MVLDNCALISCMSSQFSHPKMTDVCLTVGFTRAAGLVTEIPPQGQLQARVAVDFERQ